MSISQEVSIIGQAFVNGLKRILGQKLHGAYIYGAAALPEWKRHIELARKSYARQATAEERQFMLAEVRALLEFARTRIERTCQKGRQQGAAADADKPRR